MRRFTQVYTRQQPLLTYQLTVVITVLIGFHNADREQITATPVNPPSSQHGHTAFYSTTRTNLSTAGSSMIVLAIRAARSHHGR